MARYSALLGCRIKVTYRAGNIVLPATGYLAADSGKSIFFEEHYQQKDSVKTFRWEIPYRCILQLNECSEGSKPSASLKNISAKLLPSPNENPRVLQLKNNPPWSPLKFP
jgi:hypothetical protein